jgi:HlyD family secretion protein
MDGEVVERLADPGEVVPAGYPVVHLVDTSDSWVVFHVREDLLKGSGRATASRRKCRPWR